MQNDQINLSQNLRKALERKNWAQNKLAKKLGIRTTTLHGYLYGVVPLGLENAVKLASILNLSLDELVLGGNQN